MNSKGITQIQYNHFNLPTEIKFQNNNKITYLYNAQGIKRGKIIMEHGVRKETDYLSAFQYKDKALAYIQHAEGYINVERRSKIDDLRELFPGYPIFPNHPTDPTLGPLRPSNPVIDPGYYLPINGPDNGDDYNYNVYSYVYNYKDHLGNIRLSYADKNNDGIISKIDKEILDENNYYPFGLEHEGYNGLVYGKENQYKYQGQERQDELSLNWDSFKWRNYDYALGRFMSVDPLAEKYSYQSPYNFSENRVIDAVELEGLEAQLIRRRDANGLETCNVPVYNYQVTYNKGTDNYESKQVSTSYEYRIKSNNNANTWKGQSENNYTIIDKNGAIKSLSTSKNGIDVAGQVHDKYNPIDLGNIEATKKLGNRMEEVGSAITTASLAAEGPSLGVSSIGVTIGQTTSLAGSGLNVTADLMRGENGNAAKEGATTISTMIIGNKIKNSTKDKKNTDWIKATYEQFSNWIDNQINN